MLIFSQALSLPVCKRCSKKPTRIHGSAIKALDCRLKTWCTADGKKFLNSNFFRPIVGLSGSGNNVSSSKAAARDVDWSKEIWWIVTKSEFAKSALAPVSVFSCATRKEVLEKADDIFEEVEADLKLPFWKSKHSKVGGWRELQEFFHVNESRHILLSNTVPSINCGRRAMERATARKNGAVLALAMHRFHKENRKWPISVNDLTEAYLAKPPIDILTGKPLYFKINKGRPLIYSVGMDRDDDGGTDAKLKGKLLERSGITPGPKNDDVEGDWILWPQYEPIGN
jgi:hypothetical protein